ncbi:MAG TPA: hypothetical protein VMY37_05260 [Thermoguttaceae bacterium]|nr:hypothetical protein [Thermoguttaceae bacterium]HUT88879.1 hypothetical protein [Thermoguttaceae bacterium]
MPNNPPQASALDPIPVTLKNCRALVASILALGAAPPLMDLVFDIGPPWPGRSGISYFTTIVIWIVLVSTYSLWKDIAEKRLKRRISSLAIIAFSCVAIYVVVSATCVYNAPDSANQVVGGFGTFFVQERLQPLLQEDSVQELLEGYGFDPMQVWEPWSVTICRSLLLIAWLLLFGFLSMLTATVVLLLEKEAVQRAR